MAGEPLVSVVMPVRNAERHVREAVESVLAQSLQDLECLIVDDGSTDSTPGVLRELERDDRRVRILRQPPRGLVPALNRGWSEARGRYVARMDADDVALVDRLDLQVRFLRRCDDVAVLGGAMQLMTAGGLEDQFLRHPTGPERVAAALTRACCIAHPTVMARREVVLESGGYRGQYLHAEDYDLWLRLAERHRLDNLPQTLVRHRVHEGQVSFASIEQQAISALGARLAALRRRAGGPDPTPVEGVITRATLVGLGLGPAEIDRAVIGDAVHRANLMLGLGLSEEALRIVSALEGIDMSAAGRRRLPAEVAWLRGKVDLRRRRGLRAAGWLLRACWRRPALLLNMMRALPRAAAGGKRGTAS